MSVSKGLSGKTHQCPDLLLERKVPEDEDAALRLNEIVVIDP